MQGRTCQRDSEVGIGIERYKYPDEIKGRVKLYKMRGRVVSCLVVQPRLRTASPVVSSAEQRAILKRW